MLNYFQISFPETEIETYNLYHIQFNFLHGLKNFKYIKYKRINVLFKFGLKEDIEFLGLDSSILNINLEVNIPNHITLSDEFYKWIYKKTNCALEKLWDLKKWPLCDLKNLEFHFEETNYQCFFNYSKRKKSILKDFSAELNIELLPTAANLFVDFYNKENQHVNRVLIIKGFVDINFFPRLFSNSHWTVENNYIIQDELKEIEFIVSPLKPELSIFYSPKYNTEMELKNFIKALTWDTEKKERMKLLMP